MNKHKPSTDSRNRRLRSCTRRSCASRPLRYKYSRRSRVCFRNIIPYRSKYHVPAILKIPTNKKKDNRPGSISDRISFFFFYSYNSYMLLKNPANGIFTSENYENRVVLRVNNFLCTLCIYTAIYKPYILYYTYILLHI